MQAYPCRVASCRLRSLHQPAPTPTQHLHPHQLPCQLSNAVSSSATGTSSAFSNSPHNASDVATGRRTPSFPRHTSTTVCPTASATHSRRSRPLSCAPGPEPRADTAAAARAARALVVASMPSGTLQVQGPGLPQAVQFVNMGSPLLWARSTGLKVWPGALLLTRIMQHDMDAVLAACSGAGAPASAPASAAWSWQDKVVVELGCGLALCSIAASFLGAQALATDGDADLVRIAKKNAAHNTQGQRHPVAVAALPWGEEAAVAAALQQLSRCPPPPQQQPMQPRGQEGQAASLPNRSASVGQHVAGSEATEQELSGSCRAGGSVGVDVVLLSDVVYGSNPGIWERLVKTLLGLCTAGEAGRGCSTIGQEYDAGAAGRQRSSQPAAAGRGRGTVVLQCETRRLEGVMYDEYWRLLQEAGFGWAALDGVVDCEVEGVQVRAWAVWLQPGI